MFIKLDIPEENYPKLNSKIISLNKKAEKLGCDFLTMNVVSEYVATSFSGENNKFFIVEISGNPPILNGWNLVGQLQHINGVVMLHSIPGENIPWEYHNADPSNCDHCRQNRRRNNTFVVRDANQNFKQVGKSCLKDFTGHTSPEQLVKYASTLYNFYNDISDYQIVGKYGVTEPNYNLDEFLARAYKIIKEQGFISKSKSKETLKTATSTFVLDSFRSNTYIPTDSDLEYAQNIIEWVKTNSDDDSEYMVNLRQLANFGFVSFRTSGFATAMVNTYQQATEFKIGETSEYIGEEKDRLELQVYLLETHQSIGFYGHTDIHKLVDENGNIITWFDNARKGTIETGKIYKIKATIKNHKEFRGMKQTQVNRLVVLKELSKDIVQLDQFKQILGKMQSYQKTFNLLSL